MALNFNMGAAQLQEVHVLISRKNGNTFWEKELEKEHNGETLHVMVGQVLPTKELPDGQSVAPIKITTRDGKTTTIDASQLTASIEMKASDLEALNSCPYNAMVLKCNAIVTINTNKQDKNGDPNRLEGSLWVAPNHNAAIKVAPAPQRTAALTHEELMSSVETGRERSIEGRLAAAANREAGMAVSLEEAKPAEIPAGSEG